MFRFLWVSFLVLLPLVCLKAEPSTDGDPASIVQRLVKSDFEGSRPSLEDPIKLTKATEERNVLRAGDMKPDAITWDADAIVVVDSYEIGKSSVSNQTASVTVFYRRLALTQGYGFGPGNTNPREFVSDHNVKDEVTFNLIKDGNKWFVVDPPLPRMGAENLIKMYQDNVDHYQSELVRAGKSSHTVSKPGPTERYYEDQIDALKNLLKETNTSG